MVGRVVIAVTLLATILALWQAFSGTREARIANMLAVWSAKMDFYELCDSVSLLSSSRHSLEMDSNVGQA